MDAAAHQRPLDAVTSLLLYIPADVRSPDDVIAFEGFFPRMAQSYNVGDGIFYFVLEWDTSLLTWQVRSISFESLMFV